MRIFICVLFSLFAVSCSQQPDWQPLFEKDLSNAMDEKGVWYYEGDVLTASEDACIFTQAEYENFVIDLEFKKVTISQRGKGVIIEDFMIVLNRGSLFFKDLFDFGYHLVHGQGDLFKLCRIGNVFIDDEIVLAN